MSEFNGKAKMKRANRIAVVIAALTLTSLSGMAGADDAADYALSVNGLACPFCAYGIEKHLLRIDSVDKLEVDIGIGRVLLWVKDGAGLTRERAERAVDDAGFELNAFTAANNSDDPNDPDDLESQR